MKKQEQRHPIPITNQITMRLFCGQCAIEAAESQKPVEHRLKVGLTEIGIQVWCLRHDMNVAHIDFEGHEHPMNMDAIGAKTLTKDHKQRILAIRDGQK